MAYQRTKFNLQIIFHGKDRKSLHKYMSPKCLPECYGGSLCIPRVTGNQWLELLMMCDKEFEGIAILHINPYHLIIFFSFKYLTNSPILLSAINSYGYPKK